VDVDYNTTWQSKLLLNKSLQLHIGCKILLAYLSDFECSNVCHEKYGMFVCSQNYKKETKQDFGVLQMIWHANSVGVLHCPIMLIEETDQYSGILL
jgi:hypothetical protein